MLRYVNPKVIFSLLFPLFHINKIYKLQLAGIFGLLSIFFQNFAPKFFPPSVFFIFFDILRASKIISKKSDKRKRFEMHGPANQPCRCKMFSNISQKFNILQAPIFLSISCPKNAELSRAFASMNSIGGKKIVKCP